MRNVLLSLMLVLAISGCAGLPTSVVPPVSAMPWDRLTPGMTREAVAAIMDTKVVTGYEIDPVTGTAKPVESKSLYGSEILTVNGVDYQVDRYIVRAPAAGVHIAESELYPVVYKAGLLVTKGRDGLAQLKAGK